MLMRTDPFTGFERLAQQVLGSWSGTAGTLGMPLDVYRSGDEYLVQIDLPGVAPSAIDLSVDRDVLTVKAERQRPDTAERQVAERPYGTFERRLYLGEALDAERIQAAYEAGVLTVRIPVAEHAKPRRIEISGGEQRKQLTN
ncbi:MULTISPECIES: Hsp20/alpha crystallin family protein [Amycolatopsis]|uniref:Hsp20/alpha crystallin family protein n=1 Tax=Amycolatopsis dongchuanensis TaxID=1070866 RepID=A0ABP9R0G0_9PSEU